MKELLNVVKEQYDNNVNIISYLKECQGRTQNSFEDIMLSYDFQAGTYYSGYMESKDEPMWKAVYAERASYIASYLDKTEHAILFDAGIGEGTTLVPILNNINKRNIDMIYGLDASFSRLQVAKRFIQKEHPDIQLQLILGNMLDLPLEDNSCDIVYTCHACEPNGGNEEVLIKELLRVTKKYLILFEPAYDFANEEARERMKKHGYVINLYDTIQKMNLNVLEHKLLDSQSSYLNPTGVTVIEKDGTFATKARNVMADPISKKPLQDINGSLYCGDTMLLYPIIDDIACLIEENAIVATKYTDICKRNIK